MKIVPVTITEAKAFVGKHHRHNRPPLSALFAVGLSSGNGELIGVAIVGRPVARELQDGRTVEITRVCTVGDKNANSKLYGHALRAAKALGYHRAFTYTLDEESGISLKAAGFMLDAKLGARPTWNCRARHRMQTDLFGNETRPAGAKIRWIKNLGHDSIRAIGVCSL